MAERRRRRHRAGGGGSAASEAAIGLSEAFAISDVRAAARLWRARTDCFLACDLYADGRVADALLRCARPITDALPWLENELRSEARLLGSLTRSLADLGGAVRRGAPVPEVRAAGLRAERAFDRTVDAIAGPRGRSVAFVASIVHVLVGEAYEAYCRVVEGQRLDDYQTAQSAMAAALQAADDLAVPDAGGLRAALAKMGDAVEDFDPPSRLTPLESVAEARSSVERLCAGFGACVEPDAGGESMRVSRLLDGVAESYRPEQTAVAARAASSLFVHHYEPLRDVLESTAPDTEAELTALLGVELRRAINARAPGAEVQALVARARDLLAAIPIDRPRAGE